MICDEAVEFRRTPTATYVLDVAILSQHGVVKMPHIQGPLFASSRGDEGEIVQQCGGVQTPKCMDVAKLRHLSRAAELHISLFDSSPDPA